MLNPTRGILAAFTLLSASALASGAIAPGAFAQSQPAVGTAVETGKPGLVDAPTQQRIREYVRKANTAAGQSAEVAVGAALPESVTLYALPEDAVSEVPAVTSYRFTVIGDRIAVVDPKSRTVVQLIDK